MVVLSPGIVAAQDMEADPFAASLIGEWSGQGLYQGNELALARTWSLELGGQFLKGDMAVSMPNGASFGALTYWIKTGPETYVVTWMDGTGRMQRLEALLDPASGVVTSEYTDEQAENGPEERRWEFAIDDPDAYAERLFRQTADGWELLAEWTFERTGG